MSQKELKQIGISHNSQEIRKRVIVKIGVKEEANAPPELTKKRLSCDDVATSYKIEDYLPIDVANYNKRDKRVKVRLVMSKDK